MPGIRKGLKVRWLPAPVPRCAEPRCAALLVEVMMAAAAAASAPPALLFASPAPFSSELRSFSLEEDALSFSAGVVEEGLVASDIDGAVVVVTFAADDEEEVEELG